MSKFEAVLKRAAWTFSQAFLAVFMPGLATHTTYIELKALAVAALAAALSAVKSTVLTPPEA